MIYMKSSYNTEFIAWAGIIVGQRNNGEKKKNKKNKKETKGEQD